MARAVCAHPWRAGSCEPCPLRHAAPKGSQGKHAVRKAVPGQSPATARETPSKALTEAMADMQRCLRALTPEERATVRGQALTAHAELLTGAYRERMQTRGA